MAAPIVYRSDDANAPVARGERESAIEILTACLVNGYGTKPAAGWTREFTNVELTKAVFRNNPLTGTGFFLQVDTASYGNEYSSYIQGFETMSDVDTGMGAFYPWSTPYNAIHTSQSNGTISRPWALIADDRAFYMVVWTLCTDPLPTDITFTAHMYASNMFFGDFIPYNSEDQFACGICGNGIARTSYGSGYYLTPSSTANASLNRGLSVPRNMHGDVGSSHTSTFIGGGGPGCDSSSLVPGLDGLTYIPGGRFLISRPYINNGEAHSIRGWYPGLYTACHKGLGHFTEWSVGTLNLLSLQHSMGDYFTNYGNLLISLDDWRV